MFRIRSSSETLNLIMPKLDQFGISRIADLTYLDDMTNLYVYSATRPSAKSITTSMGKGITVDDAKCGAIAESIETYCAEEVQPDLKNRSLSELEKKGNFVLNPNNVIRSASIPENYQIDWCYGKLLCSEKEILIPHSLLSLNSNLILPRLISQNSDGIASGNNFEEALIFSFYELNERLSICNSSVNLNICKELFSKFIHESLSVNFYLHDSVFQIPVISCYLNSKNPLENAKIFAGYACRDNIMEAAKAALFEAIQSKVGIISGVRDDINNDCYLFSDYKNELQDITNSLVCEESENLITDKIYYIRNQLCKLNADFSILPLF